MNFLDKFLSDINQSPAMPLAVFPGIQLVGGRLIDVATDSETQVAVSNAIHKRYKTPVVMTAMDLSVESEAFGCPIAFGENEVPTVSSPIVSSESDIESLRVPEIGEKRTSVYLKTASMLKSLEDKPYTLAVTIGPFSLAGRLMGMNDALCLTITDTSTLHKLLEKCAMFLVNYARAFKTNKADGLLIAEPAAGLLSPPSVEEFSSNYLKQIVAEVQDGSFPVVLHNCGAKLQHLKAKLSASTYALHFGAPMNIIEALKSSQDRIILGNLDPAAVFLNSTAEETYAKTLELLQLTKDFRNFIISSGCDIPAGTKIENLDGFFEACKKNKK
mgnify:CR=1 FL=1